ncbi:MAG: hypothetical protein ACRD3E_15940 [Terriglobales bacterium]
MVSKCANPACSAPFLYLHDGRIFAVRPAGPARSGMGAAVVERYWLCGACAEEMTLVLHGGGVVLQRLPEAPKPASRVPRSTGHQRRSAA